MKSRSNELLERAKSAMVAAVEIYNKPGFPYRAESFAILAINGWELLLKARWLAINKNRKGSLYVYERRKNKDGKRSRRLYAKKNRSGAILTYGLSYLANQLVNRNDLDTKAWNNLQAMLDVRDYATHFYHPSAVLQARLFEFSAACVKNFATAINDWFGQELTEFDLHLMPLTFMEFPTNVAGVVINADERTFLSFLEHYRHTDPESDSQYSVAIDVEVRFTKSKSQEALLARITTNPDAPEFRLTEEDIKERYPWNYSTLNVKCKERYKDFKINAKYHDIRKAHAEDKRFAFERLQNPSNPDSSKMTFFNANILTELDKHYSKRD